MFVDVIHSNGENLILGGLGSWQPMGHVDFYPNGGRMQKGCTNLFVGAVTDILWCKYQSTLRVITRKLVMKRQICPSAYLIEHYAVKAYGGMEV